MASFGCWALVVHCLRGVQCLNSLPDIQHSRRPTCRSVQTQWSVVSAVSLHKSSICVMCGVFSWPDWAWPDTQEYVKL